MRLTRAVVWLVVAGCGRRGFDALAGADASGGEITPAPSTPFTRVWSGDDFEIVRGVVVLPDGDLMLAGVITQPTDLGGGMRPADGDPSLFAARLSGTGEHRWSWSLVTDGVAEGGRLSLGTSGVVLAGYLSGSGEVGGTTISADSGQDVMMLDVDPDTGGVVDVKIFGGGVGNTQAYGLATSPSGRRAISGLYASSFTVENAELPETEDTDEAFAIGFDANGLGAFGFGVTGPGNDYARAVAFDGAGYVAFGGRFASVLTLGGQGTLVDGPADGFVVIVDPGGVARRVFSLATSGADRVEDLIGLPGGDFVFCGLANGNAGVGLSRVTTNGVDVVVARVSADGTVAWLRALGGAGAEESCRLALDGERLYVGALFRDSVTVGPDTLESAGGLDLGFAAYAVSDGTPQRGWRAGGTGDEGIEALLVDPASHDLIATGGFTGATQLGGVSATSVGTGDAYVYRFAPE